jgi:hypothetical protein
MQLRLRNHHEWYHGDIMLRITTMPLHSYLKIDSYYEVPIQMLDEALDGSGKPLMIWAKHQGGLGQLRSHVRHRDQIREGQKLCQKMENQSLGENAG